MDIQGFRAVDTGGGARALRRDFDGFYMLVTGEHDAILPTEFPVDVGLYDDDTDARISFHDVPSMEALANLVRNAQGCTDARCAVAASEGTDGECWACRIGGAA